MIARRLFDIRNQYSASATDEKLSLLRRLRARTFRTARDLKQLHSALCFIRAFPDSPAHYRFARSELREIEQRVDALTQTEQAKLVDTGITGTPLHYRFSYAVATWLGRRAHGAVSIDWEDADDPPGLDGILEQILEPSEDEYFDGGYVSGREWLERAAEETDGTDFDWLLAQMTEPRFASIWAQLYDAADLGLTWDLHGAKFSKSLNAFPAKDVCLQRRGMRKPAASVRQEIMRPLESVSRLKPSAGAKMIDVAMASLAVRHRETYHFNHACPHEVYLADVGEGVSIAIFGLQNRHRFPLECTMGYLIIANGAPVGYGGASVLFRQVNTGVNIFDEYRGSEAAFLWVQVMRVYHHVTGCTRYIANPYQLGTGNREALQSGAFWFYYRLGYRPVAPDIRKLARREFAKTKRDRRYRSDITTLRRLTSCDMHLALPGSQQSDLFDERWIEISSMLANEALNAAGGRTRKASADRVAMSLAADVGIRAFEGWTATDRSALRRIAPIVAAANPKDWSTDAKRSLRKLLRAKGGDSEANYARLLSEHGTFLAALRKACRRADR